MNKQVMMVFKDGIKKALTFSYDDGTVHDRRLVALMNTYGMRGTFNLNSGLFGKKEQAVINGIDTDFSRIDAEEVKTLFEGHEISAHAVNHPSLTEISIAAGREEVAKDRKNLEALAGYPVTGFAYPYGTYNDKVEEMLSECGITYARTVVSTEDFELPQEFLEWHATCHHENERLMELAERFVNEKPEEARVFYVWGHSYEFAQKDNWQMIEDFFAYMQEHKEGIWFATNGEIAKYTLAFRQLQLSSDGKILHNPTDVDLWYELNGQIYCIRSGERVEL